MRIETNGYSIAKSVNNIPVGNYHKIIDTPESYGGKARL